MTKAEAIELAKVKYFEGNKNLNLIYGTSDGHFFHANAKNAAHNSLSNRSGEVFEITRAAAYGKVEKAEVVEEVKDEVKEVSAVVEASKPSESAPYSSDKPKTRPKKKGKSSK